MTYLLPCTYCGTEVERKNKSKVVRCDKCQKKKERERDRGKKRRKAIRLEPLQRIPGRCAACLRTLIVPTWKFCDYPQCVFKRNKLNEKRKWRIKKLRNKNGDKALDRLSSISKMGV